MVPARLPGQVIVSYRAGPEYCKTIELYVQIKFKNNQCKKN